MQLEKGKAFLAGHQKRTEEFVRKLEELKWAAEKTEDSTRPPSPRADNSPPTVRSQALLPFSRFAIEK